MINVISMHGIFIDPKLSKGWAFHDKCHYLSNGFYVDPIHGKELYIDQRYSKAIPRLMSLSKQ